MRKSLKLFFVIFTISGLSGLIYESIWSHYLKLLLGHAAYAQSLVLMIFMGGMALGSWIASRKSGNWLRLLRAYALVEGAIGICALGFHGLFVRVSDIIHFTLIPELHSPALVAAAKWGSAAALIFPQSILLGMTFPLMTGGILRAFPAQPGRTISTLYFCNSLGAAVGVLLSGFVLIDAVGLPGTIMTGGLINVVLALLVWLLSTGLEPAGTGTTPAAAVATAAREKWYLPFLLVALITGLSSFVYEIVWIRMLSMVLGSSTHSFELMLSAFILGLALGGLWIRRRIDHVDDVPGFLANVQLIMGAFALVSLLVYGNAFEAMQWLLHALSRSDPGYALFVLGSHGFALAIMLPTTFCAGMTLPLLTYTLLQRGVGERSIGAVYAANTLGAILGVLFAVHIGMPVFGLKNAMIIAAALDIALGVSILTALRERYSARRVTAAAALGCLAVAAALAGIELDPRKMASGVYRTGRASLSPRTEILAHRDGKTATIDLVRAGEDDVVITTNGKPDASIAMSPDADPAEDEITMILAAALPLSMRPEARTAANIGMGSGLTTSTLLASDRLRLVDTIEIEKAMVEVANGFRPRVDRAYTDPRSRIIVDDAKSYFSSNAKRYDIIVSEPSNPWVSGVANLFTSEFYRLIQNYLSEDGVLVQWLQIYEIDLRLVSSVIKALARQFDNYVIYFTDDTNLLIIATKGKDIETLDAGVFDESALRWELNRVGIRNTNDLRTHRIGTKTVLAPLFESFETPENSDYFPFLDLGAARTRFLQLQAHGLIALTYAPLPILEMLDPPPLGVTGFVSRQPGSRLVRHRNLAKALLASLGAPPNAAEPPGGRGNDADLAKLHATFRFQCVDSTDAQYWSQRVFRVMTSTLTFIEPAEIETLFDALEAHECYALLAEDDRQWIALFRAVARRDADAMYTIAADLLNRPDAFENSERFGYLLASAMLGRLALKDAPGAYATWEQFGAPHWAPDRLNVYLRTLLAQAVRDILTTAEAN